MQPAATVMAAHPPMMTAAGVPGVVHNHMQAPDIMGFGKTATEVNLEALNAAYTSNIVEPQDLKPADDDPSRMYFCRELDGNWTQRNRFTLDNLTIRWYMTQNGAFYAVRLED
jgi:hypothetical protein